MAKQLADKERSRMGMSPQKALEVYSEHAENKLKKMRVERSLSQQELSDATGVPLSMIRSYEQGSRSIDNAKLETLCGISEALGCKIGDILQDEKIVELYKRCR